MPLCSTRRHGSESALADDDDLEFVDRPKVRMRRSGVSNRTHQAPELVARVCALGASGNPLAAIDQRLHEEGAQSLPAYTCCGAPVRTCLTRNPCLRLRQLQGRPMAKTVRRLRFAPNPRESRHRRPHPGTGGGSETRCSTCIGRVRLCWQQQEGQAGCGCGRQEHSLGKGAGIDAAPCSPEL
jgi:hypothetical protein